LKDAGIDVKLWDEFSTSGAAVGTASAAELEPLPEKDPENPAVIMYTSGTTGNSIFCIFLNSVIFFENSVIFKFCIFLKILLFLNSVIF